MTFQICCKKQRHIRYSHGGVKKIALANTTSTKFNYHPGSGVPTGPISGSVRAALRRRASPPECACRTQPSTNGIAAVNMEVSGVKKVDVVVKTEKRGRKEAAANIAVPHSAA